MLGPSGCGKTTTLRCLAGLERPSGGEIFINGEPVFSTESNVMVPAYKRDIGMVFQSYAIWPHMDVFENVAFPLREMKGRFSKKEIRDKVMAALDLVQLSGYEDRPAPFLSGGQQQRLALARALVREPQVLLLDEPLSNLDAKLREETRTEIRDLVKRLGITTVYVTHDQLEALTMSDVIAVMDQGKIVQEGGPVEIYREPKVRFVADFIGLTNFVEGKVTAVANGSSFGEVQTASGKIKCTLPHDAQIGSSVIIVVRPEDVNLIPGGSASDQNVIEGRVTAAMFMGDSTEFRISLPDASLRLKLHPSTAVEEGQTILVELPAERCRALMG
jgi:iron(III) transport system ATP-binding protein